MSALKVWFDPVCPWCFVGYSRLKVGRAAQGARTVSIDWLPFQLSPNLPAEGVQRATYFAEKFGSAERAVAAWERVAAAGASQGVNFEFGRIRIEPNTLNAHRAVRYAKRSGHDFEFLGGLFSAYFQLGQDIGKNDVLKNVAEDTGMDAAKFDDFINSSDDTKETLDEASASRRMGVSSVPTYGLDQRFISVEQALALF